MLENDPSLFGKEIALCCSFIFSRSFGKICKRCLLSVRTVLKQQQPIQHRQGARGGRGGQGRGVQPGQFHFHNPNGGAGGY
uniref:Uncharacterized protein n=1 Tax=Romanomermis culicivorax TaxID=13658 RepID=A0A915K7P6_ROMCU